MASLLKKWKNSCHPESKLIRVPHSTSGLDVPEDLWYPSNRRAIDHATSLHLNSLLNFYNQLTTGTVADKRERLVYHLGIYQKTQTREE
jgi:hypothetical protein